MKPRTLVLFTLVTLLVAILLTLAVNTIIFEDGSFWVGPEGSIFSGCIPLQPCDEHYYHGENAGYVWDWGGIEWKGEPPACSSVAGTMTPSPANLVTGGRNSCPDS